LINARPIKQVSVNMFRIKLSSILQFDARSLAAFPEIHSMPKTPNIKAAQRIEETVKTSNGDICFYAI